MEFVRCLAPNIDFIFPSRTDLFLVATTNYIRYFNMSDPDDPGTHIPLKDLAVVVAMDYDPVEDHVYWTDVRRHTISRARSNGEGQSANNVSLTFYFQIILGN